MSFSNVTDILPKEKDNAIRKASETITKLTLTIRANIAPIFLAEERAKQLHTRYLKQRKKNIWDALEEIGWLVSLHNETPHIRLMLIERVLQNIATTRWEVNTIMKNLNSTQKAQDIIAQNKQNKDDNSALLVISLVRESGISIDWLERFMISTSRKIW